MEVPGAMTSSICYHDFKIRPVHRGEAGVMSCDLCLGMILLVPGRTRQSDLSWVRHIPEAGTNIRHLFGPNIPAGAYLIGASTSSYRQRISPPPRRSRHPAHRATSPVAPRGRTVKRCAACGAESTAKYCDRCRCHGKRPDGYRCAKKATEPWGCCGVHQRERDALNEAFRAAMENRNEVAIDEDDRP
jgi:hypothetical protein